MEITPDSRSAGEASAINSVLVVENGSFLGRVITMALDAGGYEVHEVQTPQAVLERIGRSQTDLIVFNTDLDYRQKASFIAAWRHQAPGTKILEISEDPLGEATEPRGFGGALPDAHVRIPFVVEQLPVFIRERLA